MIIAKHQYCAGKYYPVRVAGYRDSYAVKWADPASYLFTYAIAIL